MPRKRVLHRSIFKPNRFGGVSTTTLCGRVDGSGQDYNVADSDDEVTCFYCRRILDGHVASIRTKWLNWQPEDTQP